MGYAAVLALGLLFLSRSVAQDLFPNCAVAPLAGTDVCDTSLTAVERATALVGLMTTSEKLAITGNTSPGVPRIGLPQYQWWQEGLHGVASSPGINFSTSGPFSSATSFPQPILMGAAFDDELIYNVATIISTEARAFNNANRGGLNFWTPNINPFRDPRWGRGQETPGEDPYHLSSYVYSLITGLQGVIPNAESNPPYKRIIATCKHFAGYDIEDWFGNLRYANDVQIDLQDLVEYYLPTFKTCARDAIVGSFMCSYNAVNGVPTCANSYLLQTVLREHWNWTSLDQWVTSDCDAIQNVYDPLYHAYAPTRAQAVADTLNAGADSDCGDYYPLYLPAALEQGLFNESVLDRALIRMYSGLTSLGYFDPAESQPYRQLGWSDVNTPEAQALAYNAAVEGITLLKNIDNTLPLDMSTQTNLALIGPWANATSQLQGNYYGVAPYLVSPLAAAYNMSLNVTYASGPGTNDPTTPSFPAAIAAATDPSVQVIVYFGGNDDSVESEGNDRTLITWPGDQLDLITQLAELGKPLVVFQMGGGQVDSSILAALPGVSALIWGGYPGQSGGDALIDILYGHASPAGRLPITQYPASYVYEVAMTDMALRPGAANPGRTYKWYTGTPVYPFGFGLHYADFSVAFASSGGVAGTVAADGSSSFDIPSLVSACSAAYLDLCPFTSLTYNVTSAPSSATTSDYVALLFLSGAFGPAPYPIKSLVSYQRAHNVAPGTSQSVTLDLTFGSLARVDDSGNTVLYPGTYSVAVDTEGYAPVTFTLTGGQATLDEWPQP